jgi:hypothetical protein
MSSTELRCLHRIESKKRAHQKLTSTRSDVNGIQRCEEIQLRKNAGDERRLLQIDEGAAVEVSGFSLRNAKFSDCRRDWGARVARAKKLGEHSLKRVRRQIKMGTRKASPHRGKRQMAAEPP